MHSAALRCGNMFDGHCPASVTCEPASTPILRAVEVMLPVRTLSCIDLLPRASFSAARKPRSGSGTVSASARRVPPAKFLAPLGLSAGCKRLSSPDSLCGQEARSGSAIRKRDQEARSGRPSARGSHTRRTTIYHQPRFAYFPAFWWVLRKSDRNNSCCGAAKHVVCPCIRGAPSAAIPGNPMKHIVSAIEPCSSSTRCAMHSSRWGARHDGVRDQGFRLPIGKGRDLLRRRIRRE